LHTFPRALNITYTTTYRYCLVQVMGLVQAAIKDPFPTAAFEKVKQLF
jgi:hypothetical protein